MILYRRARLGRSAMVSGCDLKLEPRGTSAVATNTRFNTQKVGYNTCWLNFGSILVSFRVAKRRKVNCVVVIPISRSFAGVVKVADTFGNHRRPHPDRTGIRAGSNLKGRSSGRRNENEDFKDELVPRVVFLCTG